MSSEEEEINITNMDYAILSTNSKKIKYTIPSKSTKEEELIFNYFCDDLDTRDIRDANIVLFIGETGVGKSTAINAFFNIVKGIKLKDSCRWTLIKEEEKSKGQSESQTDGVHLYFIKDKNNKPLIIIDTQGFGDTRGIDYDIKLKKVFEEIFKNIIDHINIICFVLKSTEQRINTNAKYIFKSITELFADDVINNFIILATFQPIIDIKNTPVIATILQDPSFTFLKKINEQGKNWWYSIDSKCIIKTDEYNKLAKHSFKQLTNFYEKIVKTSKPINIKKCGEVIETQNRLLMENGNLKCNFKNLMFSQIDLEESIKTIQKKKEELEQWKITLKDTEPNDDDSPETIQEKLDKLDKDYEEQKNNVKTSQTHPQKVLISTNENNTYCTYHKKNCHEPCGCWFKWAGRCKIFEIPGCIHILKKENCCEFCKCLKSKHQQDKHKYKTEIINIPIDNTEYFLNMKKKYQERKMDLEDALTKTKRNEKIRIDKREKNKENLERMQKEIYEKESERQNLEKNKKELLKKFLLILVNLEKGNELIKKIALNKSSMKDTDDYFKELENECQDLISKYNEGKNIIKEIKNLYTNFMQNQNISTNDLIDMDEEKIKEKIQNYIQ